jgi:purine-cytosine permease-like protein
LEIHLLIRSRWAWIPQVLVLFVLIGSAGPKFDRSIESIGNGATINANRLSFFSLSLAVPVSWAAAASDFYVYYPPTTPKRYIFLLTLIGLFLAFVIVNILGIGLASNLMSTNPNPAWEAANEISSGALILAGYDGLGGFGKFCGVVVALGVIANNIPGTYSAALGFQMLGRYPLRVPRWLWTCLVVLIYFICAIVGRNELFHIFENFLALMGYWVTTFICIVVEENVIFQKMNGKSFDWSAWDDPSRLPRGYAALVAFLCGWAGCIIGMCQVWYIGPVAKLLGDFGADFGIWVGCGITLILFPGLRLLELKVVGR